MASAADSFGQAEALEEARAAATGDGLAARRDLPDALRVGLAGLCILAFWNHAPLADLSDRGAILEKTTDGSSATQVLFLGLALAMLAALRRLGFARLRPLLSGPLVALAGWMALTLLTSVEPLLSIRRVILFVIVTLLAAGVLVLMRSVRQFALTLALAATLVLVSSYLAVAFLPHLAIHSGDFDLIGEPEHDGLWRGIFAHKNQAGGGMALVLVCGLFIATALNRLWGVLIALGAAVFLFMANSKTVLALLPFVLVAPSLCRLVRGPLLRAALLAGPIALVTFLSLGSVFLPPVRDGLVGILPDTSFTGRTELWQFAAEHLMQRPVFGWGYGAFWGTERTMYISPDAESWVNKATQAHNTYLDTAVILGLPGLVVMLIAFVVAPLRDLQRIAPGGAIEPVVLFFLRLWLLALAGGAFESVLFTPSAALFCMFMVALFGLRLRAAHPAIRG